MTSSRRNEADPNPIGRRGRWFFTLMKRLISLPRWMRSRLASKQKTWTRLLELSASKTMAYFLGLAALSWGSTFLAVGEYDMRRSTREMSARMMNRTPRYRWTRLVSVSFRPLDSAEQQRILAASPVRRRSGGDRVQ
jgi:hypothetical protein